MHKGRKAATEFLAVSDVGHPIASLRGPGCSDALRAPSQGSAAARRRARRASDGRTEPLAGVPATGWAMAIARVSEPCPS